MVTVHKSSLSSEGALHLGTLKTSHDTESSSLAMVNYAFICLEKFSDLWKEIPVFDLNFSLQQPKPITSFSVITTHQHYQTLYFLSPPFMYL